MQYMVNGKPFNLSVSADGSVQSDDLRRAAGILPNRQLVLQLLDGSNRTVNPGEKILLRSGHFTHIPNHDRG